jgi:hypothetical protein
MSMWVWLFSTNCCNLGIYGQGINVQIRLLLLGAGTGFVLGAFGSIATAGTPTYSINFYTISAGGNTLHGPCFRVSGTVAQTAPGYSSGSTYSLIAGFWQPAPVAATDEIFFNGFEGC